MSLDTPGQASKSAILRLHDQFDEPVPELTVEQMIESFSPAPSTSALRAGLSLLCHSGMVQNRVVNGETRYSITRKGKDAVERNFTIDDSNGVRNYLENPDGFDIIQAQKRQDIDWQKLGTILTGFSIVVAILLAVVF